MKPILRGLFVLQCLSACVAASALEPANPNANAKARAILNYLQSLGARADKRLVSGQFTGAGCGTTLRLTDEIHGQTGLWPALVGADYIGAKGGTASTEAPDTQRV